MREAYLQERLAKVKAALAQNPDPPTLERLLKEYQEIRAAIEAERRLYKRRPPPSGWFA
ncbi:DNA primase [Thermus thermophilus]|nr:DNA primase [Thermus thermophilus]